jgi:two-component system chemotaxis sensor kinase CheA
MSGGLLFFYKRKFMDNPERLAREREDAEHAELMHAFKRLVQDRTGLEVFLTESSDIVALISGHKLDGDPIGLKRALHTLKGTAGSMGLSLVAQICHSLESELVENGAVSQDLVSTLDARWRAIMDHLTSAGMRNQRLVEIPEKDYAELVALVADGTLPRRDLAQRLAAWQAEPVEKAFRRLGDQAIGLARRFGKGDLRVVIDAGGVCLDRGRFSTLFSEFVHVVRNAVDHGIESPAERAKQSKRANGTLTLRAAASADELVIEIGDDGAGIDWESIRRAAQARGLPHRTQAELVDALCADGLTTRSEVTSLSGRGVGMAAVRQHVLAMHGVLEVRSQRGRGTTWIARFPASADAQRGVFPHRPSTRAGLLEGSEQH